METKEMMEETKEAMDKGDNGGDRGGDKGANRAAAADAALRCVNGSHGCRLAGAAGPRRGDSAPDMAQAH